MQIFICLGVSSFNSPMLFKGQLYFRTVSFPLPPPEAQRDFSLIFTVRICLSLLEVNLIKLCPLPLPTLPKDQVPLEFLTLKLVHTEPPAIYQSQFRFSYSALVPGTYSASESLLQEALTPCVGFLSILGGGGLPCVLPSLTEPRRVVLSVCFSFSC